MWMDNGIQWNVKENIKNIAPTLIFFYNRFNIWIILIVQNFIPHEFRILISPHFTHFFSSLQYRSLHLHFRRLSIVHRD